MTDALHSRVAELRERAASPGGTAVPWRAVTQNLEALRARLGEGAATAALAVDGYVAASEDEWSPDVVETLQRLGRYDDWNPRALWAAPRSGESIGGMVNSAKGTLFESQVAARVGSGEVDLPDGADSIRLATSLTQPGWDAELLADGQLVGVAQMKATDSVAYLREHMERYPDINNVVVTSEVAARAADEGLTVIDGGVNNQDLEEELLGTLESVDATSFAHEWVPVGGLGVTAFRAISQLRAGASREDIAALLKEEGIALVAINAAGLMVETATGTVLLRPITTTAVRLGMHRWRAQRSALEVLHVQIAALAELRERAELVGVS